MKTKIIKNKKGFSLAETVIYVAIFSILIVALTSFSSNITSSRLREQTVLEVNGQGSNSIKVITQTLRNGSGVNSPTVGNIASSLSIDTGNPTTNPTIFYVADGVLYITEGTGLPIALTNNKVVVSNLTFSNFSRPSTPNIIKINFILTGVSANNSYSISFDSSGALRK